MICKSDESDTKFYWYSYKLDYSNGWNSKVTPQQVVVQTSPKMMGEGYTFLQGSFVVPFSYLARL